MSSAAARHDITRPSGVSDGVLVAPVVAEELLVVGVLYCLTKQTAACLFSLLCVSCVFVACIGVVWFV